MDGILLASMDFPDPGGPIINVLCSPEATISNALFTKCCPTTSEKSRLFLFFSILRTDDLEGWN